MPDLRTSLEELKSRRDLDFLQKRKNIAVLAVENGAVEGIFSRGGVEIEISNYRTGERENSPVYEFDYEVRRGKKKLNTHSHHVCHNPVIYVEDISAQDLVLEQEEETKTFRVDPQEALLQDIERVVQLQIRNPPRKPGGRTTHTFYSATSDGEVFAIGSPYADIREGGGDLFVNTGLIYMRIGQAISGSDYFCYECFTQFDTSSIADDEIIDSVTYDLDLNTNSSVTDYIDEVRIANWGVGLTFSDFIPGSEIGTRTLVATFNSADLFGAGRQSFTSEAAFPASINKTGITYLCHSSNRHRLGIAPTTTEGVRWSSANSSGTANDPRLVIETSLGMQAETGSYVLEGKEIEELYSQVLPAEKGSYFLTGQEASVNIGEAFTAEKGSFFLTGQEVNLLWSRRIEAEKGSYLLTGQDGSFLRSYLTMVEKGEYELTGQDVTFLRGLRLEAEKGFYTLSEQDAVLLYDRVLSAASGSYVLTGREASLPWIKRLIAEKGSYVLEGKEANLLHAHIIPGEEGTYLVTFYNVTLSLGISDVIIKGIDISLIGTHDIEVLLTGLLPQ